MCASGMTPQDEELTAILQSHQSPADSSLAGVVTSSSAASSSTMGGVFCEVQQQQQQQHRFSSECSILGPSAYSDSLGGKPVIPLPTLNLPIQDQGGQSFAPCSPMLPKNGSRRQGLWSASNAQKDWSNGRNGMMEMDCRNCPPEFSNALLDQIPAPITEPYRVSGGLARYHSAPSSLLHSLVDFQQPDVGSRPMNQMDNTLSSFFSDTDLPPLNPSADGSMEHMDTEHSSSSVYEKYLLNTRKFERLGKPGSHYDQLGASNGPIKPTNLQSVYKHSMEVLHENVAGSSQMMPSSSQIPSSMGIPSSLALLAQQQQQQDNTQAGQQMNLGSLPQSLGSDFTVGSTVALGRLSNSRGAGPNNNSLLRQSSSPAGLLAQLSIEVQNMAGAKNEKQSLSSPLVHSPAESLSGGTSEENGAGNGPGTPGMMSRVDVAGWEDANSYLNSWGDVSYAARKRFRDIDMDPIGDQFLPSEAPQRNLEHNLPTLTRHMSLPTQKSKNNALADDILQSVPCRIRAKRGCATHPRSIAERVRRTRISERMRKLQELVPNMDKQQTNTADMLDEAVEYVKLLQRQVQELSENQGKCKGNCGGGDHKNNVTT